MNKQLRFIRNNKHLQYSQINNLISANGQRPMENNPDSRISRIWNEIISMEMNVSYKKFGSVKEIDLARKADDESMWIRCQPRTNSTSPHERTLDAAVMNRSHSVASHFLENDWNDFTNVPLGFQFKEKWWFILGNGRIASLIGAEKILSQECGEVNIPFSILCIDFGDLNINDQKRFVLSCSQIGNSRTGEEVEEETSDQIESALVNYWKEILFFSKEESSEFIGSYYAPAVEIYNDKIAEGKKLKEIREAVSHYFLEKEKRLFDSSYRGRMISKAFSDHNTTTGDRYDSSLNFGDLLSSLWEECLPTNENSFPSVDVGWHLQKTKDGCEFYNVITKTTGARNMFLPIAEHSMGGDQKEANIIHNPYLKDNSGNHVGHTRVSIATRQTNIIEMLEMATNWNTCNLRKNGNGVLVRTFIFPRMIDHTAEDCDGNQDCDVVYYWTGSNWMRVDSGLFGLKDKLLKKIPEKRKITLDNQS